MGATLSVMKTLIVPAVISLILFLVSTYVLVPLWQRHRGRYSHYLPLGTLATGTMSLRARITRALTPRNWGRNIIAVASDGDAGAGRLSSSSSSDQGYDSEEGEELGEVLEDATRVMARRRDLEGQGGGGVGGGWTGADETRRLSRDLEAGFRDDSDDDEEEGPGRR